MASVRVKPSRFEPSDQRLGGGAEDVVVRPLAALLGLDRLGPQPVLPAPLNECGAQPGDAEKWFLAHHPADRRAVVIIEVAVNRYAARFGERQGLFDLATLEIALPQPGIHRDTTNCARMALRRYAEATICARMAQFGHGDSTICARMAQRRYADATICARMAEAEIQDRGRASGQIGRKAQIVHGRCACSGPRRKSPAAMCAAAASTRASTPASSGVTSMTWPRRRSNRSSRACGPPGTSPRRAANPYNRSCTE